MGDDVVDDGVVGDEAHDAEFSGTGGAGQGFDLEDPAQELCPREPACTGGRGVIGWGLGRCGARVGSEPLASCAAGPGRVCAVVAELMLTRLENMRCGAGEEVEGVECDDVRAIVYGVRAEEFYLGSITGAGTGVGDGGSEQVADDALCGFGIFGDDSDGRVSGEAGVLPGVHGFEDGGGDFLVTQQEVEDAATEGVLEQGCVNGGATSEHGPRWRAIGASSRELMNIPGEGASFPVSFLMMQ